MQLMAQLPHFYIDNQGGVGTVVNTNDDFSLDLDAIKQAISANTKAIIINSPNNPTGQVYSADELMALGQLLDACQAEFDSTIFLLSDEPYRKITYDNIEVPPLFPVYRNSMVISSGKLSMARNAFRKTPEM